MCGLHGFINTAAREVNADDFVRDSFVANSLRGMDSSGIASVSTKQETYTAHKLPLNGSFFIQDNVAAQLMRDASLSNTITICHTRHATVGRVGYSTAHPFWVESDDSSRHLVGAHNGTLTGWSTKKGGKDFTVDSEWAMNHIFNEGYDAFEDFEGAYCFTWWDSDSPGTLNIALNDQRPLHVAFTEEGNMAYASEAGMLAWLCERHRIKIKGAIRSLQAGHWYKFDVSDVSKFVKLALPKKRVVQTTTTYNQQYRTPSATVVDKVQFLLDRIKGKTETTTAVTAEVVEETPVETRMHFSKIGVSQSEVAAARDLSMQSMKGMFIPSYMDNHTSNLYGTFCSTSKEDGFEVEAIIRNAKEVDWNMDSKFDVTVLGVMDTGTEITAIVSKPRVRPPLQLVGPTTVADTVH